MLATVVGHAHHAEANSGHFESRPARAERTVRHTAFFRGQCVFSVECDIGGFYLIYCGLNSQCRSYCGRSLQKTAPAHSLFLFHIYFFSIVLMILAGLPATTVMAGTSLVTTLPAPTMAP